MPPSRCHRIIHHADPAYPRTIPTTLPDRTLRAHEALCSAAPPRMPPFRRRFMLPRVLALFHVDVLAHIPSRDPLILWAGVGCKQWATIGGVGHRQYQPSPPAHPPPPVRACAVQGDPTGAPRHAARRLDLPGPAVQQPQLRVAQRLPAVPDGPTRRCPIRRSAGRRLWWVRG